jgi:hypothetical protein
VGLPSNPQCPQPAANVATPSTTTTTTLEETSLDP